MIISAQSLFDRITKDYQIIGKKGNIKFTLSDITVSIKTKDSVGNLLQEWFKAWLQKSDIDFEENSNTQKFPDFYLNPKNKKTDLLEIKTFDADNGPGFDLANFDSYCKSIESEAFRLDSDYLVFAYQMDKSSISIKNVWLKKIWELSCPSGTFPVKVQEKKNIIYNLRPGTWYSERAKFKPFNNCFDFLTALDETRHKYPPTRSGNAHWLDNVLKNYEAQTGRTLKSI